MIGFVGVELLQNADDMCTAEEDDHLPTLTVEQTLR